MKTLLFLKRLDLVIQLCALIVPTLLALKAGQYFSALTFYFAVGGAQLVGFLVHALAGKQTWMLVERTRYRKMLVILVVVAAIILFGCMANDNIIVVGLVVGFAYIIGTPVVAVFYFLICLRETRRVGHAVQRQTLIVRGA